MVRLPVRSRRWNWILVVLGCTYAVSALVLLIWYTREVWNAEGIIDRLFQIALLLSLVCGAFLALGALTNLGIRGEKGWRGQRANRVTART